MQAANGARFPQKTRRRERRLMLAIDRYLLGRVVHGVGLSLKLAEQNTILEIERTSRT
jgi:hypothetical protein